MRTIGIEYPAPREISFCELGEPPQLGTSEILIATRYSGITNGTERHALLGEHSWKGAFPGRHGYQHVGEVVAVGEAVTTFAVADTVFHGHYVGHRGWNVVDVSATDPAGYSSHLTLRIPDGVDSKQCALLGVAGVAMRGIRRFRVRPAQKVWVAGLGPIGNFAAQAAYAHGAEVTVSDINPSRIRTAERCIPVTGIDARDEQAWEALKARGPFDCIVDACNVDSFLKDVQEHDLLAHGGVVGMLAVHSEVTFNWSMLHGTEASIEVSCHFGLDDLRVLLHFLQQDTINLGEVATTVLSIDDALDVYATLRDDPGSLLGVVFDWA